MKRIVRDRHLTPEEAAHYNSIREKVEKEIPPVIANKIIFTLSDEQSEKLADWMKSHLHHQVGAVGMKKSIFLITKIGEILTGVIND